MVGRIQTNQIRELLEELSSRQLNSGSNAQFPRERSLDDSLDQPAANDCPEHRPHSISPVRAICHALLGGLHRRILGDLQLGHPRQTTGPGTAVLARRVGWAGLGRAPPSRGARRTKRDTRGCDDRSRLRHRATKRQRFAPKG